MSRRARRGLAATLVLASIFCLLQLRPTPQVQSAAMEYRLFLPGISVPLVAGSQLDPIEQQAVDLINQQRRANGCAPVQVNGQLNAAAKAHSQDMVDRNYFDHKGSDGTTFVQRAQAAGYQYRPSGEIIAAGYSSAASVVDGWMNSSGHRAIILTCENDDIGMSLVNKAGTQYQFYWTAVFGQR